MVVWILPIRELEATLHRHGAVAGVLRAAGAELRFRSLGGALLAFRAAGHWRRDPRQPAFLSDVEAHRAADSQEPALGKRPNLSLFLRLQTARSPDAQHKPPAFPHGAPTTIGHHSNWRKTLSDRTI